MEISTSRRLPWALIGIALSVLFILLSIPKKWEDAARTGEGGALVLTDDWTRAVERKQEQYAEHELYALLAARAGYYQCGHCPGGRFFLKEMEVYRYGVTGLGQQGRGYSDSWLSRQALSYNMILTADLTTVKMQEAALIGSYAVMPENLARPLAGAAGSKSYWYRLVLPPGNNSLE